MSELATAARPAAHRKTAAGKGFRPDIQGIRAIAVAMVVIYHLYPARLPGGFVGVDVFFVISGYLITGHLWRGYSETGKVSLPGFWGRRARRLVPAAALVLTVTWVAARFVQTATQLAGTAQQILASALYFQNWQLAHDSVDYLKSNDAATPVQHFWSLSVEEQFYLLWPLLFLLAALVTRLARPGGHARRDRARRVAAGCLMTALVAGSLAYSVWYTNDNPAGAYFVTTTRMWELGTGGLLAIAPSRMSQALGRQGWLAWLGLAAIVVSAFTLSGSSPFPGYVALLPVLGSAALIAGGSADGQLGTSRLMSARPMVFLGGISYSLYLWHYPVITLFTAWHGKAPGLVTGPVLAVVSVLLAWLTKTLIEDTVRLAPFIARHEWRSVSTALAAVVPVALVAVFIAAEPAPWNGQLPAGYPGAAALTGSAHSVPAKTVLPPPAQVTEPAYWTRGCLVQGEDDATAAPCVFGDTKNPKLTVALVGDSIAGNWWAALNVIATQEHWKLVTDLHADCPWSVTMMVKPDYRTPFTACRAWGATVLNDLVTKIRPQVVITTSVSTIDAAAAPSGGSASRADIGDGEATYWKDLEAHGIKVAGIRETPELNFNAVACTEKNPSDPSDCETSRSTAVVADPPTSYAARQTGGKVPVIDMNDLVCTPTECPAVVGNVLVYFDNHHFTQSYSQTLAPFLKQRLLATGLIS